MFNFFKMYHNLNILEGGGNQILEQEGFKSSWWQLLLGKLYQYVQLN